MNINEKEPFKLATKLREIGDYHDNNYYKCKRMNVEPSLPEVLFYPRKATAIWS